MYPFREGDFAPRISWYVAAFCEDIGEQLLSRWILGDPVVLYQKADGEAVAVGGRCPHRYFPLGESRRIGDTIQCGYHGITFGPDGRVPAWETAFWPVLDEDIFATEEIEYIVQTSATLPPELMLKCNATAVEGGRMLQRMMDAERG